MHFRTFFLLLAIAWFATPSLPAFADAGHDHGDAPLAASAQTALPRFAATSDVFELVGVLADPGHLILYLDRSSDNAPVVDAKVELDIDGTRVVAVARPGTQDYEASLPRPLAPGIVAITATVTAGSTTDAFPFS